MNYPKHSYQHPKDIESFINLKSVSWVSTLSKKLMADELEKDFYLLNLMDNVLMTECDFPVIHGYLDEACEKLNLKKKPVLFLDTSADPKTLCIGEKNPMLIVSTALLEILSPLELKAAICHEVGHLACGHSFYKIMVENFSGITQAMSVVPGLTALGLAAKLPLYDWFRKADLSADRAAVLTLKNPESVISMIGKIAGGSVTLSESVSEENLLKQSEEIERITDEMKKGGTVDKITYLFSTAVMNGMMRQNPWPSIRIKEIRDWCNTEEYKNLLNGIIPDEPLEPDENKSQQEKGTIDKISSTLKFWK
ncbi:MAG: M48 family metallopeptidase [Lentisphaeraceae bacterium]|nr:M48 family metallopeptidase [Lentisphaeraceae bacterium]